ncbi:ABC transporter substrate-binding protein [Microbacterium jiangjiandongii]|uniref:ABC transporter substrate-binding protein n=1 Tax=Microbacterium jiangjiandongii TaxID=3049071 RepID=UPI00214D07C9|nr:ABC transporter substrate-binding protein [Microbacterium sp. zg.Y843]MCR2817010.1 ABC transporter substrate-binding protein [Microbacterium sp. zg.Y843]
MSTARIPRRLVAGATALAFAAVAFVGCATADPLDPEAGDTTDNETIVIGSQAYYSNEIIAEIYAQALEDAGYTVERSFNIGQRDAYMPEIESGAITLFPEYTGNLLQYYDPETTARTADDVYGALVEALPDGLTVLEQSEATDQDSYTVTAAYADENGLTSIADLADIDGTLTVGGPPELAERPYGRSGLAETYGVEDVVFEGTGDTSVEALTAGEVDVANVFTADPRIQTQDLVVLEDPEGLFLASNVVPLVNEELADELAEVIDPISAALTPEGLVALNVKSTEDEQSSEAIATAWLEENGLI